MVEARSRKERLEAKGRRVKAKLLQEILVPERIILSIIPFILILWLVGSITNLSRNWGLQQEVNEKKPNLHTLSSKWIRMNLRISIILLKSTKNWLRVVFKIKF